MKSVKIIIKILYLLLYIFISAFFIQEMISSKNIYTTFFLISIMILLLIPFPEIRKYLIDIHKQKTKDLKTTILKIISIILGLLAAPLILTLVITLSPLIIIIGIPTFFIYEYFYFKSDKFTKLKSSVKEYVDDSNQLNNHIEELKKPFTTNFNKGLANFQDISSYNYKRSQFDKYQNNYFTHNCSLQVCRNAKNEPFKYFCKYFDIKQDEESLEKFEKMLNDFSAVEESKTYLNNKYNEIFNKIKSELPFLIRKFRKNKVYEKLGLQKLAFNNLYFPKYTFLYISAGGNASTKTEIVMDINNLNKFVEYLNDNIKWRNSIQGQRALMTSKLRNQIKERDNYTCQICNNSINNEPNLLLEIDHKIPLSKGGMTKEENLQTLCWRCNRTKGSKIIK